MLRHAMNMYTYYLLCGVRVNAIVITYLFMLAFLNPLQNIVFIFLQTKETRIEVEVGLCLYDCIRPFLHRYVDGKVKP
jgi:hypothetical protein